MMTKAQRQDVIARIFHNFDWQVQGLVVDLAGYESENGIEYVTIVFYRDNYDALPQPTRLLAAERSLILRQLIQQTGIRCELEVLERVPK